MTKFKSVCLPTDDHGDPVHAHGGQISVWNGTYYWIGENRTGRNKVSCYCSEDLQSWRFCNHLLTLDSPAEPHPYVVTDLRLGAEGHAAWIGQGCNIERPKVLYCEKTGRFVMWMHWEEPDNYGKARCAVAVCDRIDGAYTYLGSFNPIGEMSRDCTLFLDEDGKAYFVSSSRDNLDLRIYRLTEDFLGIDRLVRVLFPGQQQEAPVLFRHGGRYFLLTSGCTGWAPNQSSYSSAARLDGDWAARKPLGNRTTYRSQPTWVLPVADARTGRTDFWYIGDRWGGAGEAYFQSEYVFLPLRFGPDGALSLEWSGEAELRP